MFAAPCRRVSLPRMPTVPDMGSGWLSSPGMFAAAGGWQENQEPSQPYGFK